MAQGPQVVVLLGGPGAGKGTQAHLLSASLGIPHISSGELLRELSSPGTQSVMTRGDLLADDVVTDIVLARLEQPDAARGAVLDGFPRTLEQARALDRWLDQHGGAVRAAISLEVPADELSRRIAGRAEVSGRSDDRADTTATRLEEFHKEVPAVLRYYAERGLLREVDGARPVEEVQRSIMQALAPPRRDGSPQTYSRGRAW
jgi:adenylate kinase